MNNQQVNDAAEYLRMEYDAMPGLQLTLWQARRLLHLPDALCDRALAELLESGYLTRARDGEFRRAAGPRPLTVSSTAARHAV